MQTLNPEFAEFDTSSSSSSSLSEEDYSWIPWFCSLKGNEFFLPIDPEFIKDDFNLTGLNNMIENYEAALAMILDSDIDDSLTEYEQSQIESDAEALYGLIHARFLITSRGFSVMAERYKAGYYGTCPRVYCVKSYVLPCGLSDTLDAHTVKLFCPTCSDLYEPRSSKHDLDGAYFGTTFPHYFFMHYPELRRPVVKEEYAPRIFGFRINKTSYARCLEKKQKELDDKEKEKEKK